MLGSDYRELIVPKLDNQTKTAVILIGGIALTVAALGFGILSGSILGLVAATACGFGTWYLFFTNRIEYEYVINGDDLEITKILSQSKRKPMIKDIPLRKLTAFGELKDAEGIGDSTTLILACSQQDDTAFYADFDHSELGTARLVFTPNDDILEYISKRIPRSLGYRFVPRETEQTEPAEA